VLGQRLHNFAIMRLLGEGGMSSVYEAEHALIQRKVAVKVLKSELSVDSAQVQRFFNEARATSAIRHPNIVEVIDVGRLPDGVPYLVMELLEGESLGERLERLGSLEIAVALDYAHQAASALVAAHALRIVHRDLKPDNLFLVPDERIDDRELVKVLDFGIAKLRGDLAAPPFDTMVGAVLGTPPYMSPEQCRGLPEEIDERTDIYALGIILYEMLCGRPPFLADGAGELMMMHMTVQPEPPSRHNPEISPELEQVILRMLAKRREDRFATMLEFDQALTELSIALGVVEPYVMRRSVPAAVGGAASGHRFRSTAANFASDTTLSAPAVDTPRGDREREKAVTRALSRRPSVEPEDPGASGVVALGLHNHAPTPTDSRLRVSDAENSAITSAAEEFDEEPPTSQRLEVEVELPEPTGRTALAEAPKAAPPMAAGEPRLRAWLPVAAGAACLIAALAFAISTVRRAGSHRETSTAAASNEQPVSAAETTVPMSPPEPLVAAASSSESQLAVAAPQAPAMPVAEPTEAPSHPSLAPIARAEAKPRGSAQGSKSQPTAASRKSAPPAVATAAKTAPEREKPSDSRERVEGPKLRRGAAPRTAALSMSDFENETAAEAASGGPHAPAAQANPNYDSQPAEPGYLSLDSAPWSDVFLGTDRLGTTPLIRVPLPPGKYLLTLRNPELGVSTSYAVEIHAGKTVSRLVGWEHR